MKPHPADTGLQASHKNLIKTLAREIHSKAETETIIHIRKLHGCSFWQKLVLKCKIGKKFYLSEAENEQIYFMNVLKNREIVAIIFAFPFAVKFDYLTGFSQWIRTNTDAFLPLTMFCLRVKFNLLEC